jgi:tRNA A-37 threonylcarbamoyl transferase component Bud32
MSSESVSRERRLQEILAAFLQDVEAGKNPDRQQLLVQHPDLAEDLRTFLAENEKMRRLVEQQEVATLGFQGPEASADAPVVGTKVRYFGDYELLEEIARGGMGVVYKARQVSLNRIVALKMIRAGQLASDQDVARFRLEAEAAAQLEQTNIVPIYEIGEYQGQHFFSMKLVSGGSMAAAIGRLRHQPRETARLLARVARAVHHAHQRGLLHRDLKPANVLLDEQGEPVVTDFGLARRVDGDAGITQSGVIVGTPSYMPPEQARGKKGLTTAVDVYALGAILYECLTGRPPFRGPTPLDTVLAVLEREPEPPRSVEPAVDRDLEQVCLKCLRREPEQRYPTAAELAEDLECWLNGKPVAARPLPPWRRGWRWARRHPVVAAASIAAVVYVAVLAVGFGVFGGEPVVILLTAGFFGILIMFPAMYTGLRDSNRIERQMERLTAAIEGAGQQPAAVAPSTAEPEAPAASRRDVLLGMLQGWYGVVIALTAMFSLHLYLILAGPVPVWLWPFLRAALEGGALGALAGGGAGLFWGTRGRPEGVVAWTLVFPLVVFGGLVGPFMIPPGHFLTWVLPLMLFAPMLHPLAAAAQRLWPPPGAKAQAQTRFIELAVWGAYGQFSVIGARLGVLLVGCVVGLEVGFAVAAVVGQIVGALLGTVAFWLAAVALDWWPRKRTAEDASPPQLRPAILAALGGMAVLWLYWGALRSDDEAVVLLHPTALRNVVLSPDARWLLSQDGAGIVRLWDVETGKLRHTFAGNAQCMSFSADGQAVLLSGDREAAAYALAELALEREKPKPGLDLARPKQLAATRAARLAGVAGNHERPIAGLAWLGHGDRLVSASEDGRLYLWRFAPRLSIQHRWRAAGGALLALAATEELALSGGTDGTIDLWQLPAGTPAGQLAGHRAWVAALAVTPDGRRAASAGCDGTVRVWDLPGRRLERTFHGHREMLVGTVAISSDGRLVASGGLDGTVRLWRLEE